MKEKTLAPRVRDRRKEKGGALRGRVLAGDAAGGGWRRRRGIAAWWHSVVVRLQTVQGRRQRVNV